MHLRIFLSVCNLLTKLKDLWRCRDFSLLEAPRRCAYCCCEDLSWWITDFISSRLLCCPLINHIFICLTYFPRKIAKSLVCAGNNRTPIPRCTYHTVKFWCVKEAYPSPPPPVDLVFIKLTATVALNQCAFKQQVCGRSQTHLTSQTYVFCHIAGILCNMEGKKRVSLSLK